jgi:hypothetical protein
MRRGGLVVVIAAAAVLAALAAATNGASAATCPPPPTPVQPFASWSDSGSYVLTTGASFENGTSGWTLTGGAGVVAGNAPNALDPSSHSHALYLPSGSSATSPCTTAPHILGIVRFFAKNSGVAGGLLKVDLLVKGGVYPAGTIGAGDSWAPSPRLDSTAPNYSGAVAYQIRLTPVGAGSAFTVDDLYFDPAGSR